MCGQQAGAHHQPTIASVHLREPTESPHDLAASTCERRRPIVVVDGAATRLPPSCRRCFACSQLASARPAFSMRASKYIQVDAAINLLLLAAAAASLPLCLAHAFVSPVFDTQLLFPSRNPLARIFPGFVPSHLHTVPPRVCDLQEQKRNLNKQPTARARASPLASQGSKTPSLDSARSEIASASLSSKHV